MFARNFFCPLTTIWMKPIKFNAELNMKTINRCKALSFFLISAYLLAACGGTLAASTTSAQGTKGEANTVAFTGIVEAMNGTQWTVSGQPLRLDSQVSLDPSISVGDSVKVEANVSADGAVVAMKVESFAEDDAASTLSADASTPDPVGTPSADVSSLPEVISMSDASSTQATGGARNEIFGTVEAMAADSITIDGVTYNLAQGFSEVKSLLAVGDQVKLHVIANADGTFTVPEIEKSATTVEGNGNSNDGLTHDLNDDHSANSGNGADDSANHDSNDDHGGSGGNSGPGGG